MFQQIAGMKGQRELTQDIFRSLLDIIGRNISVFNQHAYSILADVQLSLTSRS
jgi:hypothetical protein